MKQRSSKHQIIFLTLACSFCQEQRVADIKPAVKDYQAGKKKQNIFGWPVLKHIHNEEIHHINDIEHWFKTAWQQHAVKKSETDTFHDRPQGLWQGFASARNINLLGLSGQWCVERKSAPFWYIK